MASGPEHYAEAERLLDAYAAAIRAIEAQPIDTMEQFDKAAYAATNARALIAKAHVHAELAQAAAVARATQSAMFTTAHEWRAVLEQTPRITNGEGETT